MSGQISDPLFSGPLFCLFLAISIGLVLLARRFRLFSLPRMTAQGASMSIISPLIAFLLYVGAQIFLPLYLDPLLKKMHLSISNYERRVLAQLISLVCAAMCLLILSRFRGIWGNKNGLRIFGKGVLYAAGCYPVIMTLVQLVHIIVDQFGTFPRNDQLALVMLKNLNATPWLFWAFVGAAVTIVPLAEELLFRGFFQNYMVGLIGQRKGIVITSLLFALFHYSGTQAVANIELLVGLFVLSCMIGVLYIKEQSLLLPLGLHSAFNGFSLALVLTMPS